MIPLTNTKIRKLINEHGCTTWWLHASENPSSILCVVSGDLCTFFLSKSIFRHCVFYYVK